MTSRARVWEPPGAIHLWDRSSVSTRQPRPWSTPAISTLKLDPKQSPGTPRDERHSSFRERTDRGEGANEPDVRSVGAVDVATSKRMLAVSLVL